MTGGALPLSDFAPASRLIAAGVCDSDAGRLARFTLTLHPTAQTSVAALARWPQVVRAVLGDGVGGCAHGAVFSAWISPYEGKIDPALHKKVELALAWTAPDNETSCRIDDFWRRMMSPPGSHLGDQKPWLALQSALAEPAQAREIDAVIPTPHSEVALAFTLERGRFLLDALATGEAGLRSRARLGAPSTEIGGWANGAERDWLEHYRHLTALAQAGEKVAAWPHPHAFANAALSRTGGFCRLVAHGQAAHRLATRLDVVKEEKCHAEDPALIAKRRLGAILGLPVLQRLVGFAVDLTCPLSCLQAATAARFVALGSPLDHERCTLARSEPDGSPPVFLPATEVEAKTADSSARFDKLGLVDLGRNGDNGPHYDICTVDPTLAAEGDVRYGAAPLAGGIQTLRSGGLRLVDRNRLLASCKPAATVKATSQAAGSLKIEDADALQTGTRLLVAVRAGGKVVWRCPQHRLIEYADPDHPDGLSDWLERELERRIGPPGCDRRLNLDAAPLGSFERIVESAPGIGAVAQGTDAKVVQLIAESCIAAWGGQPMGSETNDLPSRDRKVPLDGVFRVVTAVVHELNVTRRFAAPSAATGQAREVLGLPLRFGWPYHLALPRIFAGGGCLSTADAAAVLVKHAEMALPATDSAMGRRYLRHERLDAPMVAFPEGHLASLAAMKPLQEGAAMIVRSSSNVPSVRLPSTRRLLFAPPVPRDFAALHGSFDKLPASVRTPPCGLRGLTFPVIPCAADRKRVRVGPLRHGERAGVPYFPDPAASFMVVALRATGADGWLGDRLAVPICDDHVWPDALPVHLELLAAPVSNGRPRLVDLGRRWLGGNERLLDRPKAGAVAVHAIAVHLGPGEDVTLRAWMVPAAEQLARWFDAVEAAALLATHEGAPKSHLDSADACARGLSELVGTPVAAAATTPLACTAAAGMPVPPPSRIRLLAEAVYQSMLRDPLDALSSVLDMQLTHAVACDLVAAPRFDAGGPKLARRTFPGGDVGSSGEGETRASFIGRLRSEDWDARCSEENAKGALFGGAIALDLATTGALELEIECASPSSDRMDDETRGRTAKLKAVSQWPPHLDPASDALFGFKIDTQHRVSFPMRRVSGLRIDGLPPPADEAGGMGTVTLEDLQMASWRHVASDGSGVRPATALRAGQTATLTALGARLLRVRPAAIARHAGLMPNGDGGVSVGAPAEVWMPSTIRPAPPVVERIDIGLREHPLPAVRGSSSTTYGLERATTLRVWLARPWFSSGEGEQLGIVLWPPAVFAGERGDAPAGMAVEGVVLDEDLGPGGRYVTRWGADPTTTSIAHAGPFVGPDALDSAGARVRSAFMPLPPRNGGPSIDETAPSTQVPFVPTRYLQVALATYIPRVDPVEELWYVDIGLKTDPLAMARVRLGLVRYQTHAREDERAEEGSEPVRLRVSAPTVAWIRPLPGRRAEATVHRHKGAADVYVTLRGPSGRPAMAETDEGPTVEIELCRARPASGHSPALDETCTGANGPCLWQSWLQPEAAAPIEVDGGWLWTCVFTLPHGLDPSWRYAAVITESDRRLSAMIDPKKPAITSAGPRFLARIELS